MITSHSADERNTAIVQLVRAGSPAGMEALLDAHGELLHAVAYSVLGDYHVAEEVTADSLLAAWRRIDSLRDDRRLRSWLLRIATRNALQHLRRTRQPKSSIDPRASVIAPENAVVSRLTVRAALDNLPDRMRAVIALRYLADLTVDEIARTIGKSRNTVKTELRLGLQHLRRELADWED